MSVFAQGLQKVFLQKVAQLRLFLIAVQNKSQNTTCKQPDLCNVTWPGEFDWSRLIQIKNDHGWPRITTGCGADRSITIRNYRLKNSWVQSISANLTFFTVKQTLLHSRMWHIQVKVTVNLNFECGAITFRGWLWIPSHSQNSWFWIASCIFKVIFSQQSDILWRSDIFCSSAEVLQ